MRKLTNDQKKILYISLRFWNNIDSKTAEKAIQQADIGTEPAI